MTDRRRATSYNDVAEAYDLGRPGYPESLIDAVVELAQIPPGGRILEIGCGSGQATLPFARRGYRMVCLEPGTRLAALARERLSSFPGVEIRNAWCEEWTPEPHAFDLVLAATSIHHVEPNVRYALPARVLRPGGALALLDHFPGDEDPGFRADLDAIYARWWGAESGRLYAELTTERRLAGIVSDLQASGCFRTIQALLEPMRVEFDAPKYLALLDSDSGRLALTPADHEKMKSEVAAVIARRGGTVWRGYLGALVLARGPVAPPPAN